MSLIGWLFFGLLVGFIASKLFGALRRGCFFLVVLGLLGAVVGGFLFRSLGHHTWFHFSLESVVVAVIGAGVVLLVFHGIGHRR